MRFNTYYSKKELMDMGFKSLGNMVMINRDARIMSPETISIGDHVLIDAFAIINGNITIGNYTHIGSHCEFFTGKHSQIVLGNFSGTSSVVSVYALTDEYVLPYFSNPTIPSKFRNLTEMDIIIGDGVVVGTHSVILPGAHLGDGCSFGAFSLIRENTEPGWVYAGIPCKKICRRDLNEILKLKAELQQQTNKLLKKETVGGGVIWKPICLALVSHKNAVCTLS